MAQRLPADQALRLRIRAQRLCGPRPATVPGVLQDVFALQAQDTAATRLAVRARSQTLDVRAVNLAWNQDRSVVRTWAMRGTLHLLAAEDVRWVVDLLGPGLAAGDRRRRLQLGLDDALIDRSLRAIRSVLASIGPLTRAELIRKLSGKGITVDPTTNAAAHVCFYAAANGVICRGPDRDDDEPTYVLLDDWIGERRQRRPPRPLAELAGRYFKAYGPASLADFVSWAGISMARAREGLEGVQSGLVEVQIGGVAAWMLPGTEPAGKSEPCVRLLGAFDAYLLGYSKRDLMLDGAFARRVQAGGGWIHPTVVVDGRIVATWRLRQAGSELTLVVDPFGRLPRTLLPRLEAEARQIGRFLGRPVALQVMRGED